MSRHLATPRARVLARADCLEQDIAGCHPEAQDERLIPVVGEQPVTAGTKRARHGEPQRFVAGSGYLEIDPALALEGDSPVVQAREMHASRKSSMSSEWSMPRYCAGVAFG